MRQRIFSLKLWQKKPMIAYFAAACILLLFFVVRIAIPCREYEYNGSHFFETGSPVTDAVIYAGLDLDPGVWLISLEYETDSDLGAMCTAADSTVFSGGILTNGEPLYSGLGQTHYAMWLYERSDNLQIRITYDGQGNLTTGRLTITETNQLWTMLMTVVLFLWVAGSALMTFYYYDKAYSVAKEKKHVFFCLSVISLIVSIPFLCGYNLTGADHIYHLHRIEGVKDGLLGGQFPVRLEPKWLYDHGYADAIFYCNTFLYFPAILRLLGFTVTAAYNAYCILMNIATVWISYYCFGRMMQNRNIGILCSALYSLSVIRTYKLIFSTSIGEASAITFIPLVIYGLYRIFTESPREKAYKTAWIPIMLGVSGLIQTHVLTCEISAFVIIIYCLVYIRKVFCRSTFWTLFKSALFSVLISLWFLVPFLDYYLTQDVHIKYVSGRTIQNTGLYFAHLAFHFWTDGETLTSAEAGMQNSHPIGVGLVLMIGIGVFLLLWFSGAFRKKEDTRLPFIKTTALIGVLLLFMSLKIFPWDRIQFLHPVAASLVSSLQFSNRFLGWGTACLIVVFGYCLKYCLQKNMWFYWTMTALSVIGITTSDMYLLDFLNRDQTYYELYNEEGMGSGYISGAEYLIQGTDSGLLTFSGPKAGDGVEIDSYEKDYLRLNLSCISSADIDSFVELPLLFYKGYMAVNTETKQPMPVFAGDNNKVCVRIPAGFSGNLQINFVSPFYWRIAEIISLGTCIALIVTGLKSRRQKLC